MAQLARGADGAPEINRLRDASGATTRHYKGGEQPLKKDDQDSEWSDLIDCLIRIGDDLKTDNDSARRETVPIRMEAAVQRVRALWAQAKRTRSPIEDRLRQIERKLDSKINQAPAANNTKPTWAAIAAQGAARAVRAATSPTISRPAVRLRMPEAKDKTPEEILTAIKPVVGAAYAVRVLRSGDIEAIVPNQQTKDRILSQATGTDDIKILRQDYPVELWGVPLSLKVETGKEANNQLLIQSIISSSRHIAGLAINKVRWLHTPSTHTARQEAGKTRGTLIISLPTQATQHEVVKKGLVINSELFEAQLHDLGTEIRQCFRCHQWGHTQGSCGAQARCGECAGAHQTKDCPKESVSCTNCGRAHRAWQRAVCRTFQAFRETAQAKKAALQAYTAAIRQGAGGAPTPSRQDAEGFTFVAPRKRAREQSSDTTVEAARRSVGRPTTAAVAAREAARDRSQSRITIDWRPIGLQEQRSNNVSETTQGHHPSSQ